MSTEKIDLELDTSGKCCPMPIVDTNKAIKSLNQGDVLKVTATDPGTQNDIPSWCERTGHQLMSSDYDGEHFNYVIRKS